MSPEDRIDELLEELRREGPGVEDLLALMPSEEEAIATVNRLLAELAADG